MKNEPGWKAAIAPYLRTEWLRALEALEPSVLHQMQEIRFRSGRAVMITSGGISHVLSPEVPLICTPEDLDSLFMAACDYSPASRLDQIQNGYILLRGGLRMGISGRCVEREGKIRLIHPASSLNIRILREIKGAAMQVTPKIRSGSGIHNTLILAPPGGGKTTLLRDAVRILSGGEDGGPALRMGVVDERGELAGSVMGIPTLDVGPQCDVLDGCSKAWGMERMIRTMAPQVIAVDEIGQPEDAQALGEAARCGVGVLATAHGSSVSDLIRPLLRPLIENGIFSRVVLLNAVPGTSLKVEDIDGR